MRQATVHQQLHGYRKGHQLLSASVSLSPEDQDAVDRLSDLTGSLRPGEVFDSYLSLYPLPSEEHYVLARTFQDLDAQRSGCVLTRSVLVPMGAWVELESLERVLAMLVGVEAGEKVESRELPIEPGECPVKVSDPRVIELVQALFWEGGEPVVVFGATEAEAIAVRLLLALWPGLRRRFSICTFALGPRRLGGRWFDLVFSPATVRSRFVGQAFRRIGVRASASRGAPHRRAGPTAVQVFESDRPSLVADDVLRVLADDEVGDRAVVRVALLWNELASRAPTSPTAVLGMLDILNSRGGPGAKAWGQLRRAVGGAMDQVVKRFARRESWEFLMALDAKVQWETAPKELAEQLEITVREMARDNGAEALEAVNVAGAGGHRSIGVLRGVADGVAATDGFGGLADCLGRLGPGALLKMVDASAHLGKAILGMANGGTGKWIEVLRRVFEGEDAPALHRARLRLLPLIEDWVVEEAIPDILGGIPAEELADVGVAFGTGIPSRKFNEVFAEVARRDGSVDAVREALMSRAAGEGAERLVLGTLRFCRSDVEWLLGQADEGGRTGRLLTELLAGADASALESVLSGRGIAQRVVSVLRAEVPSSASQVARVLMLDLIGGTEGLDFAFVILPVVGLKDRVELQRWIVREGFARALPGDDRVGKAVSAFGGRLEPRQLVVAATGPTAASRRVAANLVILDCAPGGVRDGVVKIADILSRRLVDRRSGDLGEAAYRAWSTILRDISTEDPERRIKAAATVFGFALRQVRYPVSELVVATFPIVYAELVKLKEMGDAGADLRAVSSYFWLDWKKPRSGRRELIEALVSAYMRSSWPPADLIIAGMDAGVEDRIAKRVRASLFGGRYLAEIERDTGRLDEAQGQRIRKCVSGAAKRGT